MINNVEELGAELNVERLGDAFDVVVFKNGKIEVYESWANQRVTTQIATEIKARAWIRRGLIGGRIRIDDVDTTGGDAGRRSGHGET